LHKDEDIDKMENHPLILWNVAMTTCSIATQLDLARMEKPSQFN